MPTTTLLEELTAQALALKGGPQAVPQASKEMFAWPIVTEEDVEAVANVIRTQAMSKRDISAQFEKEWAAYNGVTHALSFPSGTMSLQAAMWAVGIRRGDELICPTTTYWASALQVFSLGGTVVFADVQSPSQCLDPAQIERHISPRTRAIMVVHLLGHPADMDAILAVARKHKLKVIEDCSHAHGALYKGRMVGTMGDVAAMSMMGMKTFAIGEAGMLVTNDNAIYQHAVAFSNHYRNQAEVTIPELKRVAGPDGYVTGLPLGGLTTRMNQTSAAMGRVQLKYYNQRIAEIDRAMRRFWSHLADVRGLIPQCTPPDSGSTMGGWYNASAVYEASEFGGLDINKFAQAVQAEGSTAEVNSTFPLHLHPMVNEADVYGDGKPTRIAFATRDLRQPPGSLPVAEGLFNKRIMVPWFKHDWPEVIERHAAAWRKVAQDAHELL